MNTKHHAAARRAAYRRIDATCPKIEEAVTEIVYRELEANFTEKPDEILADIGSHMTAQILDRIALLVGNPLREALIDCEEEKMTLQEKLIDTKTET